MVTCAVPGCNSSKHGNPQNYTFHIFPQNIAVRQNWLKMINRDNWVPKKYSRICSKHFDQKCFNTSGQRVKLRSGSVPTLFMPVILKPRRKVSSYVYRDISPVPSTYTANLDNTPREKKMEKTIKFLRERLDIKQKKLKNLKAQKKRATERVVRLTQHKSKESISRNFQKMGPVMIVHGGAGDIPTSRVEGKINGVKLAASLGMKAMLAGGSSLDAVEAAVVSMEKDEAFNAGYGSVLNLAGEVEMEASIMSGEKLDVGAVTLIKDFAHPISVARSVLTDSPHSLIGGHGAKTFALDKGFQTVPPESLISPYARQALDDFKKHGVFGLTEIGDRTDTPVKHEVGTVGAVAIDSCGHIAVATSTGGMSGKAVGRIGDTPQIGSGTYADDYVAGVSTTGHGESILKYCLAHEIVRSMDVEKLDAQTATKRAIEAMTARLRNTAGAITIARDGDIGVHFSSQRMAWASVKGGKMEYGIECGEKREEDYI